MRYDVELPWGEFKTQVLDTGKFHWIHFYLPDRTSIFAKKNGFSIICQIDNNDSESVSDFEENYKNKSSLLLDEVVTQLEKDDKSLCLASCETDQWTNNRAILSILIPGNVGEVGRYIKDGYAFTDVYKWGTRLLSARLNDFQFAYAGILYPSTPSEAGIPDTEGLSWSDVKPDGVVLGDYCDVALSAEHIGWRLWCEEGNQGGCEVNSLAGYGTLFSQCKLELEFSRPDNTVTKVCCNLEWGSLK